MEQVHNKINYELAPIKEFANKLSTLNLSNENRRFGWQLSYIFGKEILLLSNKLAERIKEI